MNRRPSDHRLRRAPNKNLPSGRRVSSRYGKHSPASLAAVRRDLDELRLTVQDIQAELSARLQPLTAIPTGNDKLSELCHAIHEIYENAPFAAAWIFESAEERDSSGIRLRQALCDALGPRKQSPSLSRLLTSAVGVVGPWQVEMTSLHTRQGRLFRVSNVSKLLTKA